MSIASFENKLNISHKKTCSCMGNRINCLTGKEWIKNQVAIWELYYEKRDYRDKNIHPAMYPISLPAKCIELFTHKGELVINPFVGSGSTLIAARDLNRNAVGFDLNSEYIELCNERLSQKSLFKEEEQIAINDDALKIPDYLEEETVSLSVTSPPYANMLNRNRLCEARQGVMSISRKIYNILIIPVI
jgi:DNA modification methylase